MSSVARYLLADYLRSRRWVAPFLLLVAGVVVLYADPPNPVLETAGGAAAFLLLAQCWIAGAFLTSQPDEDRHVLVATVGGRRFVLGRLGGLVVRACISSVVALLYPWLADEFECAPRPGWSARGCGAGANSA
jgi:hypothetical protein